MPQKGGTWCNREGYVDLWGLYEQSPLTINANGTTYFLRVECSALSSWI